MTHDIDHDLRALDPTSRNTNGLTDRALDDLNRIMSSPAGDPTSRAYAGGRASRGPRRRTWATRALPVAAAVAAVAVLAPSLYNDDSAFASWTAQPAAPAVDDVAEAGRLCADFFADIPVIEALADPQVALAEQRGAWTYTVLTTSDDQYVDCLMELDRGLLGNLFGPRFASGGGGVSPLSPEPPGVDRIEAVMYGGSGRGDSDVVVLAVSGRAGDDVQSVVAHTPETGDVQATVHEGYWAAWWPTELEGAENPTMDALSFTVTLRGGSSYDVAYEAVEATLP